MNFIIFNFDADLESFVECSHFKIYIYIFTNVFLHHFGMMISVLVFFLSFWNENDALRMSLF